MKIKERQMDYQQVIALPREKHHPPQRPSMFFRTFLKTVSAPELRKVGFTLTEEGMEKLGKDEPALFLMNHSSFIDLKIASVILWPRPFNIICTSDGFVGKAPLMRAIGCIPTRKFLTDVTLVRDMNYAVKKLRSSILMYPEASYTFDGTATPLPDQLGRFVRMLKAPVVMIKTEGAFARDPLYNMLQIRDVKVSAKMTYVMSGEEAASKSPEEINRILRDLFSFDNFRDQQQSGTVIDEPFRADGLNRVLYKCPFCGSEGTMEGKGAVLTCKSCGSRWTLTETGYLEAESGKGVFDHVPEWYSWERQCVRKELEEDTYKLDVPVLIRMLVDTRCIYTVGEGRLTHDLEGFHLTGCGGMLDFSLPTSASYSLYSDYFWYELGDMICIGDENALYYCFPKEGGDVVAKTRLAAEELYKMTSKKRARS